MDIETIPGVGEKTAEALSALDDPERALSEGDVATLSRAPGISDGRAARIARAAIRQQHGDPGGFAATSRAQEIYRDALELVADHAVTRYAERRLETFYPSPSRSRVEEAREFAARAMEREPDDEIRGALAGVEPLESPPNVRVRDRCLATTDAETYARAQEVLPEVSVEIVDDARGLADLARGYATVIALDDAFTGVEVEGDVRVEPSALDDPATVVPERTLAFFAHNRNRLRAAVEVHRVADLDAPCDLDALETALGRIDTEGNVADDEELQRLQNAVDDLDAAVSTAESVANDRLREAIEERDVTIEGADLLSLVEQGAGVDSLLQRELADEYAEAVADARDHLIDALGLDDYADVARRAFPDQPTFPVQRDEEVVSRLREELTTARDRRATRLKREVASDLADAREDAERLAEAALELDVELAIARFAREYDCTMPEFGGRGVAIEGGRSPLLDVPFDAVDPVDYRVEGVALLTGVNSGGKTSVLDLVALTVTLAHMGLPVPAERARVEHVEELHYHAKTQGTLDAGAFESTLREFGSLVDEIRSGEGGRVLVLVDELESITEPGASAKIMAGILEAFDEREATAVFVTHLAREIQESARSDLAVDGIEAEGLVDGELKVDRSPVKDVLARSTPELIVEKLADERDGFYVELLEKFD
ncbi:helix-hairpin-helix domain-containing protein [Halosimplex aquaticum]|uniref:DNA-binding protein MutS2 n=1 Tax=Halosimplex aquaticum TaxID=3026162 RepID=A0ABD5Y062_9EURY|nr:helix-hairpin-helix domain-containing protein [Halosimplex aquaticum]